MQWLQLDQTPHIKCFGVEADKSCKLGTHVPGYCGTIWWSIHSSKSKDGGDLHGKAKYVHFGCICLKLLFWTSLQRRMGLKAVHMLFRKRPFWQWILTQYAWKTWLVIVLICLVNRFLRHTNTTLPYLPSSKYLQSRETSISQNTDFCSGEVHVVQWYWVGLMTNHSVRHDIK